MTTRKLRLLNATIGFSAISVATAFALDFAATLVRLPLASDSILHIYLVLMVIGAPLCFVWIKRNDDRAHPNFLERRIIDSVGELLPASEKDAWIQQVEAIRKVQRLPGGLAVNFYMHPFGRNPYLDLPLLSNRDTFDIARVRITLSTIVTSVDAIVWCTSGKLFSIEYKGSLNNFDDISRMYDENNTVVATVLTE